MTTTSGQQRRRRLELEAQHEQIRALVVPELREQISSLREALDSERSAVQALRRDKAAEIKTVRKQEAKKRLDALSDLRSRLETDHEEALKKQTEVLTRMFNSEYQKAIKLKDVEQRHLTNDALKREDSLKVELRGTVLRLANDTSAATSQRTDGENRKLHKELDSARERNRALEEKLKILNETQRLKFAILREQLRNHETELNNVKKSSQREITKLLDELKTKERLVASLSHDKEMLSGRLEQQKDVLQQQRTNQCDCSEEFCPWVRQSKLESQPAELQKEMKKSTAAHLQGKHEMVMQHNILSGKRTKFDQGMDKLRSQVQERDKIIEALRQSAKEKDRRLELLTSGPRKDPMRHYYRHFMELEPVLEEDTGGGGEASPTSTGSPSLSPPPDSADVWAQFTSKAYHETLYSDLLRDHVELQRAFKTLQKAFDPRRNKLQNELILAKSRIRDMKRALKDLSAGSGGSIKTIREMNLVLSEHILRLQSREAALTTQTQELREQNELLEFRILELQECYDNSSVNCNSRHVSLQVDDSGALSLPTSEETDYGVHDLRMEIKNEELKQSLVKMARTAPSPADQSCLRQVLAALESYEVQLENLQASRCGDEAFSITLDSESFTAKYENSGGILRNSSELQSGITDISKSPGRIIATVFPFTTPGNPIESSNEVDLKEETKLFVKNQLKNTECLQESGIFEEGELFAEYFTQGTQTESSQIYLPEQSCPVGDLSAEIQKLTQIRERIDQERGNNCTSKKLLSTERPDSCQSKEVTFYRERLAIVEEKLDVYEASGDHQTKLLSDRLQREVHLAGQVKQLTARVAKLADQNRRLEEDKCEFEEAENDTRLRCQKLEAKLIAMSDKCNELESLLLEGKRSLARMTCQQADSDRKERSRREHWELLIGKYEQRNYDLEEREVDMRHQFELVKSSIPALITWNLWNLLRKMQFTPREIAAAIAKAIAKAGPTSVACTPRQPSKKRRPPPCMAVEPASPGRARLEQLDEERKRLQEECEAVERRCEKAEQKLKRAMQKLGAEQCVCLQQVEDMEFPQRVPMLCSDQTDYVCTCTKSESEGASPKPCSPPPTVQDIDYSCTCSESTVNTVQTEPVKQVSPPVEDRDYSCTCSESSVKVIQTEPVKQGSPPVNDRDYSCTCSESSVKVIQTEPVKQVSPPVEDRDYSCTCSESSIKFIQSEPVKQVSPPVDDRDYSCTCSESTVNTVQTEPVKQVSPPVEDRDYSCTCSESSVKVIQTESVKQVSTQCTVDDRAHRCSCSEGSAESAMDEPVKYIFPLYQDDVTEYSCACTESSSEDMPFKPVRNVSRPRGNGAKRKGRPSKVSECSLDVLTSDDSIMERCACLCGTTSDLDLVSSQDLSEVMPTASCVETLRALAINESDLKRRIADLEEKEVAYMETLKQADEIVLVLEESYKERLATSESIECELRDRVRQLEDREKRLKRAFSHSDESEQMQERIGQLEQREVALRDKMHFLEVERDNSNQTVIHMSEEVKIARQETAMVKDRVEGPLKSQLNKERERSKDLQFEVEQLYRERQASTEQIKSQLSGLRSQLNQSTRQLIDLDCTNSELREEVETLEANVLQLKAALNEEREQNERHSVRIERRLAEKEAQLECARRRWRDWQTISAQDEMDAAQAGELHMEMVVDVSGQPGLADVSDKLSAVINHIRTCESCSKTLLPALRAIIGELEELAEIVGTGLDGAPAPLAIEEPPVLERQRELRQTAAISDPSLKALCCEDVRKGGTCEDPRCDAVEGDTAPGVVEAPIEPQEGVITGAEEAAAPAEPQPGAQTCVDCGGTGIEGGAPPVDTNTLFSQPLQIPPFLLVQEPAVADSFTYSESEYSRLTVADFPFGEVKLGTMETKRKDIPSFTSAELNEPFEPEEEEVELGSKERLFNDEFPNALLAVVVPGAGGAPPDAAPPPKAAPSSDGVEQRDGEGIGCDLICWETDIVNVVGDQDLSVAMAETEPSTCQVLCWEEDKAAPTTAAPPPEAAPTPAALGADAAIPCHTCHGSGIQPGPGPTPSAPPEELVPQTAAETPDGWQPIMQKDLDDYLATAAEEPEFVMDLSMATITGDSAPSSGPPPETAPAPSGAPPEAAPAPSEPPAEAAPAPPPEVAPVEVDAQPVDWKPIMQQDLEDYLASVAGEPEFAMDQATTGDSREGVSVQAVPATGPDSSPEGLPIPVPDSVGEPVEETQVVTTYHAPVDMLSPDIPAAVAQQLTRQQEDISKLQQAKSELSHQLGALEQRAQHKSMEMKDIMTTVRDMRGGHPAGPSTANDYGGGGRTGGTTQEATIILNSTGIADVILNRGGAGSGGGGVDDIQSAIDRLQVKCRAKDKMIASLADELRDLVDTNGGGSRGRGGQPEIRLKAYVSKQNTNQEKVLILKIVPQ